MRMMKHHIVVKSEIATVVAGLPQEGMRFGALFSFDVMKSGTKSIVFVSELNGNLKEK